MKLLLQAVRAIGDPFTYHYNKLTDHLFLLQSSWPFPPDQLRVIWRRGRYHASLWRLRGGHGGISRLLPITYGRSSLSECVPTLVGSLWRWGHVRLWRIWMWVYVLICFRHSSLCFSTTVFAIYRLQNMWYCALYKVNQMCLWLSCIFSPLL